MKTPSLLSRTASAFCAACMFAASPVLAQPETGNLIYRGNVFTLTEPSPQRLFTYERRVSATPSGHVASHITREPQGRVIIVEFAQASPTYELQRFEASNLQMGFSGSVVVSNQGRHLDYQLNQNGKVSTAAEEISAPAVSGPQLFGFILQHWAVLRAGQTMPVRMIVLKDKTTYGFDIRFEGDANQQTAFTVTPSSFLIRLAIAPMRVVFDSANKTAVRYEGRVPPMDTVAGKLKDLEARVDYETVAPIYR